VNAARAIQRCAELDACSAHPERLERFTLTPEHARANALVEGWMRGAGMRTWVDAAGNQYGRIEGREPGLPALLLGSHLDTVPDAGSYDGMLGVVMALEAVERLAPEAAELPFAVEVVGFGDEEGVRFGTALMGSYAAAGHWNPDWWQRTDAEGTSVAEAFTAFGLEPARIGEAARSPAELVGYLEAHIEQGPYLEEADASLGYVTTIAGARRFALTVQGEARHAGATPYERRKDALVGAGEIVTMVERVARSSPGIATVGRIEVSPGAVNVIAGQADMALDVRAATDAERDALWEDLHARMLAICAERGLGLEVAETHIAATVRCAEGLTDAVRSGIAATEGPEAMGLWSRAGHDAMAMALITEVGMLFVRCRDGISHHPGEQVREIDVGRGIEALTEAVRGLARETAEAGPR
jgi:allantoate deiminase